MPVYLDCNATTPLEPRVGALVRRYMEDEFGNAGSRTHDCGARAKKAVEHARRQVAAAAGAKPDEVLFTSGATEANNLAILGLARNGEESGRRHVVSTAIEHKAVLEPLQELQRRGFSVTLIKPREDGRIDAAELLASVREDTLLVTMMHANNETGVLQPVAAVAAGLSDHPAWLHTDAAQGFGKDLEPLRLPRVDLISVSGHKLYAPKGVGALIARRRGFSRPPLTPLVFGGGQERGLRPGTLPVPLVAGLGLAVELAVTDGAKRRAACLAIRERALAALEELGPESNFHVEHCQPHVLNLSFPGVHAEAAMVTLKSLVAISNGSACTSHEYAASHVLAAMGLSEGRIASALRLSWCHLTPEVDWAAVVGALGRLL